MSDLDELLEQAEEAIEKGEDLSEVDADHHGEKPKSKKSVEEEIKQAKMKNEDAEEAEADPKAETEEKEVKKAKTGKAKVRSKKYQEAAASIEKNKKYPLEEAIELAKKTSLAKFDAKIEAHIRLLGKSGKPEQVRGLVQYPNSTGRQVKVVVLDEAIIDEIAKSGKIDADIYLATPELMPKVAKLAKILGPKGKMPNPKSGTVTTDTEKTKKGLEGGQTEYKTDSYGTVHQVIGKASMKADEIAANYKALMAVLPKERINSITLCATMGPGVKVVK